MENPLASTPFTIPGENWGYEFQELPELTANPKLNRPGLKAYVVRTRENFRRIASVWSKDAHTEWLLRQYLSLKLVMAATLQFGSADHAYEQNIQMAVPYLSYYGMFNAMRANLLSSPRMAWGRNTLLVGHDKARQQYIEELKFILSKDEADEQSQLLLDARKGRELFSYRFPSAGAPGTGGFFVYRDVAERFGRIAAELALLNSFILSEEVEKQHGRSTDWKGYIADMTELERAWKHAVAGAKGEEESIFPDKEDLYRVSKMRRQVTSPMPFIFMIGEGGIDSFFGSFTPTTDADGPFDPDEHWNRLLELP